MATFCQIRAERPCLQFESCTHVISTPAIHQGITFLLEHLPAVLHLVICTRADPPLPIGRLRARNQLTEIRVGDLRFTPEEAAIFLNQVMRLELHAEDIAALETRTEGWIVGLQLAALSMQGRTDVREFIAAFSGSHHFILEYLAEEVLNRQSKTVQHFLLQTSILDRLCGPLCDAVTEQGDSSHLLDYLRRANLFVIPLDDEHCWYRYHPLFADLLRVRLKQSQPNPIATLHERASKWYEQQDMPADAIEQAFAAGNYACTVRLLENHAQPIVLQGYAQTVENWLRRLPQEWRIAGPRTNLAFGYSLLLRTRLGEIEPYLSNAETAAVTRRESGDLLDAAKILVEAKALRSIIILGKGTADFRRQRNCPLLSQFR